MLWISFAILFLYLLLVGAFIYGWKKLPEIPIDPQFHNQWVSLVVPFRNEAANLPQLLSCLARQTHRNFELILVNDHSTDDFLPAIDEFRSQIPALKLVHAISFGKKNALKEGIAQAQAELIACTDADCLPDENYLQAIAQQHEKTPCDLLICPVRMTYGKRWFEKLQALEFASLIASGAGAAALGKPILCNGANLVFTAQTWRENQQNLYENEPSGDDMFLLMSVKRHGGKIAFLKSRAATVATRPSETLTDFFNQRKRWTSKSKSYTDWQIVLVGLLIFSGCLLLIINLVLGFFNTKYLFAALSIFTLKTLADSLLLVRCADFFSLRKLLVYIPLLAVIYPFYVVASALGGLFGGFKWKMR